MPNLEAQLQIGEQAPTDERDYTSEWHAQTRDMRLAAHKRKHKRAAGMAAAQAGTRVSMTHHWAAVAAGLGSSSGLHNQALAATQALSSADAQERELRSPG